jgi:CheY-like chemotaxis protein
MVIEPEVLIRMTVAAYLRECGYKVIEGIVAGDVWTVLQSGVRLDVVFSEVQLAGENDGFSLARRLRQTHPVIDVILASGRRCGIERLCEEAPRSPTRYVAARIRRSSVGKWPPRKPADPSDGKQDQLGSVLARCADAGGGSS